MFYALGKRLTRKRSKRLRGVFITLVLFGFVPSFFGFRGLVAHVYPALGYLRLISIGVIATGWFRRRGHMSAEAQRRLRLQVLADRRLDPRRKFTQARADEIRRLSSESKVPNAEPHAVLIIDPA